MQEIIDSLNIKVGELTAENNQLKSQLKFEQIKGSKNQQILTSLLQENIAHASTIDMMNQQSQENALAADQKKIEEQEELKRQEELKKLESKEELAPVETSEEKIEDKKESMDVSEDAVSSDTND